LNKNFKSDYRKGKHMLENSKIYNFLNEVEYQDGSVVSKVIEKKSSGNVTLFAFDKGEFLSPHSAPYDALVHIIDGSAEVIIDEQPYILNQNEFIIMPADIKHSVKATERFKMILTMLKSKE